MSEELGHQGTILEKEQAFGSSLLWQLQSNAYGQLGANAWGQGPVPLYITSNPFIARQHAAIAHAFLRDWDRSKGLDRSEPVYFIDIGAGCGRFAYIFRQELRRLLDMDASLREMKLIAVLSEIVPGTVEYWKKYLYLRRLLKEGAFDVALYDAIQGTSLRLQHSGRILERGACVNPILATANYLFDTIPQDLFRVSNGTV
ncbi:MAG: hypothetical protein KDK78_07680 [Chlamydiia bacterium]|nr:hypothetical protein [Chlamydiia bacterium]